MSEQKSLFDLDEALKRARARREARSATAPTLDLPRGEELKKDGMEAAARGRKFQLEKAHEIAVQISAARGEVSADDVYERMLELGLAPHLLGNAWGSVFKDGFIFVRWQKSRRASNHGRFIQVHRLT